MLTFWRRLPATVRTLLGGLCTAALSGGATMLGSVIVDPDHFNLQQLQHLGIVFAAGATMGVVNWLRQSPWKRTDLVDHIASSVP